MANRTYNIVLVVADTYRKDNARLAGDSPSPFFRKLQPFYTFERCFSSAPWTLPACSSILSGLDSSTHGYFFHNRPLGRPTIGHYLNGEMRKVALVNNRNLREFTGFPKDFDEYQWSAKHEEPFDMARRFLSRTSSKPYFLLFHSNIPHDYFREASEDYYREAFPGSDDWFCLGSNVTTWTGISPEQRTRIRAIYDASTRQMEERLAALLDLIDLETTIVCFVADHGEGFDYQRVRIHHGGRLHDDLIRVPMVLRLPAGAGLEHHEKLAAAQGHAASIVDILPTLLQLSGLAVPKRIDGRSLLEADQNAARTLIAEDKRYLYRPGGERFNVNFRGRNTSFWSRIKNFTAQETLIREFNLKAFVRYPYKLIITSYRHPAYLRLSGLQTKLVEKLFFSRDPLVQFKDVLLSLELFDLDEDGAESANLLSGSLPNDIHQRIEDRFGDLRRMVVDLRSRSFSLEAAIRSLH
jgi:arylsulfatase A-like enzyme